MKKNTNNQQIQRVFVSSTYEDMEEYRQAAVEALMSIEQMPIGMENFIASTDNSLDVCLTNVRRCQMLILLIGMMYGSIDDTTGKSYTELEYEEAERNNIPVLAFLINERECPILPVYVDKGSAAEKLQDFKDQLKKTKYCATFTSKEDLKNHIIRSVNDYFQDQSALSPHAKQQKQKNLSYEEGLITYRKFLLMPDRVKDTEVYLRVRMDGLFANTFLRRKEFYDAYGLRKGDTIIAENVIPVGDTFDDMNNDAAYMDMYAEGEKADWVFDNKITTGVVFEGKFKLAYELVKGAGQNQANSKPFDSKVPALILLEGIAVVGKSENTRYSIRRESIEDLRKFFTD